MDDFPSGLVINATNICYNDTTCWTRTYFDIKAFQPTYIIVLLVNTVLAILFTFFATFVIWVKSTAEMRTYKWSILNIIWTSLCLEVLLCAWMPIPMFPIFGGYNGGVMEDASLEINLVCFLGCLALFVNLLLAFFNFLLYQVLFMRPKIKSALFSSKTKYFIAYLTVYLIFAIALLAPLWLAKTDEYTLESFNRPLNSSLYLLFYFENTFGFDFGLTSSLLLAIFSGILGIELFVYRGLNKYDPHFKWPKFFPIQPVLHKLPRIS